jgi:hypothetical protein
MAKNSFNGAKMKIEIVFADSSGLYEKSFLNENFPYFAKLFDSGMRDAEKSKLSLPMRKTTFQHLDLSDKSVESFLDLVGILRESGSIQDFKNAMTFLQERIFSHFR